MLNEGSPMETVLAELRQVGDSYFFYLCHKLIFFGLMSPTTFECMFEQNKDIVGTGYVVNIFVICANIKYLELEYVDGPWFARFAAFLNIYYKLSTHDTK